MILTGLLWMTSWNSDLFFQENKPLPSLIVQVSPQEIHLNLTTLVKINEHGLFIPEKTINSLMNNLNSYNWWPFNGKNQQLEKNGNLHPEIGTSKLRIRENKLCTNVPENIVSQSQFLNIPVIDLDKSSISKLDLSPITIVRSLENFFNVIDNPVEKTGSYDYKPVLIVKGNDDTYQIWVKNTFVAKLPDYITAKKLQSKLEKLVSINLEPEQLKPGLVNNIPSIMLDERLLFAIDKQISNQLNRSADILAIEWTNNLRIALNGQPLTLVQGQIAMYKLTSSETKLQGLASWYGKKFHGRVTANGEIYNQNELTVAHRSLPFNTYLKVTNLENGKSVIVRVNDRGPYVSPRSLDLSKKAANCINSQKSGVIAYEATILRPNGQQITFKSSPEENQDMNKKVF